jgi:NAD(P)-dependent dehydrogenase (short-subunit alcohol dehydrogenase family)
MRGMHPKRILLTGASSGVGLATVERLARGGAQLALVARGEAALEEAAERARALGAVAHVLPADLADREAATAAVEAAVERLGGLDVVISNAGAVVFGHFLEVEAEDFDRAVDITFGGAVNVIRAALPELRATQGTLIAVSSMMARLPLPAFSSYTASKHALRGLINTLAVEEREQGTGVKFAMIEPGPLDTPIYSRATSATGHSPAKLFDAYHPDEIAKAIERALDRPRREHVVGGESKLMTALYETVRPAGELALVFVDRWYRIGGEPAEGRGSLYEGNPAARLGDGHPARRSGDVFAFARNMVKAGARAASLGPALLRSVPEKLE